MIEPKELKVLEKQVTPLVQQADSFVINSVESIEPASVFLRKLKDTENSIEAKRLEFTAPLNQSLKAINETFRLLKDPLERARVILTHKILVWKQTEAERLEKEEARRRAIQEAHERAGHEVKAPVVLERPENKIGNTQTRKVWTFKIVDPAKVPDLYKVINQVAVREAIRNGMREIAGLEIYQEEQLSIV